MPSFAKATVVGHLGRDPELTFTPQGTAVCKFSVATSYKSGENEQTTWWNITVWGRQAENANQYLAKGRPVYLEGRVSLREWTDREGGKRQSLELNVSDMQFLGSRQDSQSDDNTASKAATAAQAPAGKQKGSGKKVEEDDAEIPF
jgi:single-strand DNA-binding protein